MYPYIPLKVKRRVVKRAFYSSEEDESTEEEFEEQDLSITTPEASASTYRRRSRRASGHASVKCRCLLTQPLVAITRCGRRWYGRQERLISLHVNDASDALETTRDVDVGRLQVGSVFTTSDADLGADLDPDHRLLLRFVKMSTFAVLPIVFRSHGAILPVFDLRTLLVS